MEANMFEDFKLDVERTAFFEPLETVAKTFDFEETEKLRFGAIFAAFASNTRFNRLLDIFAL